MKRFFRFKALHRCALISTVACLAGGSVAARADTEKPDVKQGWKIAVGPGIFVAPSFPGSAKLKAYPFPALDISYNDRLFSQGPDVLGVNVFRGQNYHVGTSISFDFQSRDTNDDPRLHGLANVHFGPKLRLFADYTWWAFTGSVALYQDIAGNRQGKTVMTDVVASAPIGRLLLSVGPGFTWADAQYTRTFFGVTPEQSAASGLRPFEAGSGIRDVHMNIDATYDISRRWTSSLAVTTGLLQHDAAASPITEHRFELNVFASVGYRF